MNTATLSSISTGMLATNNLTGELGTVRAVNNDNGKALLYSNGMTELLPVSCISQFGEGLITSDVHSNYFTNADIALETVNKAVMLGYTEPNAVRLSTMGIGDIVTWDENGEMEVLLLDVAEQAFNFMQTGAYPQTSGELDSLFTIHEPKKTRFDREDILQAYFVLANRTTGLQSPELAETINLQLERMGFEANDDLCFNGYDELTKNGKAIYHNLTLKYIA